MVYVGVVGAGNLGVKIAGDLAYHGHIVRVYDNNPHKLNTVYGRVEQDKKELKEDGLMIHDDFIGQVLCFTHLEEAIQEAEIIIEAVAEVLNVKQDVLERISHCCRASAIIGTTSLRLPVDTLFERVAYRERTIGMRFLHPVYCIPEVEINPGKFTTMTTIEKVRSFVERMGKTTFLKAGLEPLILTEEQRTERREERKQEIMETQMMGGKDKYLLPQLKHRGNFAPPQDDLTATKEFGPVTGECAVCLDGPRNCVFRPCNHMCVCSECGKTLSNRRDSCPICRTFIADVIRVYTS